MLYGYDIDGVCSKGVDKKTPYVVISGRTIKEYLADDMCAKLAKDAPVYVRGAGKEGDREHAGNFKAMMIKFLGVNVFYEDEEYQAAIIRSQCPDCTVIIIE